MARRLYYRGRDEVLRAARSDVATLETDIQRLWKRVGREDRQQGVIVVPVDEIASSSSSSSSSSASNCSASGGDCYIPPTLTISVTTWSWPTSGMDALFVAQFPQTLTFTDAINSYFPDIGNGTGQKRWVGPCMHLTYGGSTSDSNMMLRCNRRFSAAPGPTAPYPLLQRWAFTNSSCTGSMSIIQTYPYQNSGGNEYEYTCDPFYVRTKLFFVSPMAIQFEITE